MNSHHTLHVSSELNCSLCGSRLHNKLNSKKPNIFRWYGIFVSEMHSCLYWCARLFAYICRRSCVPCPIRRCLPLPLFSKGMLPEFFPWLVRFSLTVDICWRFAPTFEAMVPCRCFDRSWHWASWPVQMQVVHEHEISKDFGWVNYGTEIHLFLQESRNPAFTLWRPPA